MIAKMKSEPYKWRYRNQRAMRRPPVRPALVIHDAMVEARETIVDAITAYLQSPVRHDRFPGYSVMPSGELRWNVNIVYDLLTAAVRTADRFLLLGYARDLARMRHEGGFPAAEVCDALLAINQVAVEELLHKPAVAVLGQQLRDTVTMSVALAIDGIQDAYEELDGMAPGDDASAVEENERQLEAIVARLNAFYQEAPNRPRSPATRAIERSRSSGA